MHSIETRGSKWSAENCYDFGPANNVRRHLPLQPPPLPHERVGAEENLQWRLAYRSTYREQQLHTHCLSTDKILVRGLVWTAQLGCRMSKERYWSHLLLEYNKGRKTAGTLRTTIFASWFRDERVDRLSCSGRIITVHWERSFNHMCSHIGLQSNLSSACLKPFPEWRATWEWQCTPESRCFGS